MDEIKETWKPIEGYEGIYEVSNRGQIRNIKRGGRIMSLSKVTHGYLAANLSKDGKTRSILVHRIVAKAFIPNHENKAQVNHKDMDKANNCVDNLEWMTQEENLVHAFVNKPTEERKNPWRNCRPEQKQNYTANLWRSNLLDIRAEKGYTREQLAEASCVRIDTIEGLETGRKCFRETSVNTVCKLAWALGVKIEALFDYDVEEAIKREQAWHDNAAKRRQQKGGDKNGN